MSEPVIAINQRIPLDALEATLLAFLKDQYDANFAREQLQVTFTGENRLRKGVRQIGKMVLRSPLTPWLEQEAETLVNAIKTRADRNLILTTLLTTAYPFAFDTLRSFGKYFQVQAQVSTPTIKKSLAHKYGGHRATENGLTSVNAMLVEAGLFTRVKPGLFERKEPGSVKGISVEAFQRSFLINIGVEELASQHRHDPYFYFLSSKA